MIADQVEAVVITAAVLVALGGELEVVQSDVVVEWVVVVAVVMWWWWWWLW